jgi:nucleotide-binding universal stress UspA family protein
MPKTVVVPLDGSTLAERALRPAAEVARRAGAHVVVMTALRRSSRRTEAIPGRSCP